MDPYSLFSEQGWESVIIELQRRGNQELLRNIFIMFPQLCSRFPIPALNPYAIFPEEVWKLVIDGLKDPNDVLNLFAVYPELETLSQKLKTSLLFDQVIGNVLPYLTQPGSTTNTMKSSDGELQVTRLSPDLLSCRQVSKMWRRQVDNFLIKDDNAEFSPPVYFKCPYGSDVQKFLKDFKSYPSARNPFVGRSIIFDLNKKALRKDTDENYSDWDYSDAETEYFWKFHSDFWTSAEILLTKFGQHLHSLDLNLGWKPYSFSVCITTLNCLYLLPNLKRLKLWGAYYDNDFETVDKADLEHYVEEIEPNVKLSMKLESLDFKGKEVPQPLVNLLVNLSSTQSQLRKLSISLDHWEPRWRRWEDCWNFPKLTDLTISGIGNDDNDIIQHLFMSVSEYSTKLNRLTLMSIGKLKNTLMEDYLFPNLTEICFQDVQKKEGIENIILSMNAPILQKMDVQLRLTGEQKGFFIEEYLFRWLNQFRSVQELKLDLGSEVFESWKSNVVEPCLSLRSLEVLTDKYGMEYSFLEGFPNLEKLVLVRSTELYGKLGFTGALKAGSKVVERKLGIFEKFESGSLYESNIWEVLPKLGTIIVKEKKCGHLVTKYSRVEYDVNTFKSQSG